MLIKSIHLPLVYFQSGYNKFTTGRSSTETLFPPRYTPMHAEIGNMDREMHIDGPSNDVDLEAFRGITDTYASIPDEWKSDLFLI